ncbi:unnamed protein product [Fraxinus pennsylvanica]|uniref:Flavone synthase II n=1 Tax=Fraxinus pennsylvanica TaxID=56036 RepID=A0AAD1YR05_9LAMI|nr:unnamed protein product [Fraxinus pennsylvanica]
MAEFLDFVIYFLIWLISTILIRIFLKKGNTSGLPPSPLALPVIGHLHLLSPIPHQALAKLSQRCGPLIHLFLGSVPCVVASSPEMAKEFLKTYESSYSNRPQSFAVDYLTYGSQDFSFAPYGPYWKFMKKLCMSELLGGQTLELLLPVRRSEMRSFMEFLLSKASAGKSVDIGGELIRLTNNVISRMIMGERCSEDEDKAGDVRKLVQEIAELTGKFNLMDFIWFCKNLDLQGFRKRLKKVRDRFDAMMERIIDEHQNPGRKLKLENEEGESVRDLLDILLNISANESSEMSLTRENIKAFILDIFAAGTDTSAITTEWALAELINHPNILHRAQHEINSVVGQNKLVEESDISNLPYLQAIVKETLRLHPTGPLIVRESSEDCTIAGYHVPAKTRLFVNVWAIGRDPEHWENPLEFRPERFLNEDGYLKAQLDVRGQHYHLLPFGSGRRGCPGTSLALQVVQTTLAAMIQCFEWNVEGNGTVDMEEGPGITLPKAHPLICFPVARLNQIPSILFNDLTGSIPPELSLLQNLEAIHLDWNKLTGNIPESFGKFTGKVPDLYLSHNNLTGSVPRSLGDLNFTDLDFSRNKLVGDISFLFGRNKTLQIVDFSRNMFEFDLSKVQFPDSLQSLDLNHNRISGSLQQDLTNSNLQYLNVSYNRLCGQIPMGGNLQSFDISSYFHNKCLCGSPLPACN